jgi:hypothetical protein
MPNATDAGELYRTDQVLHRQLRVRYPLPGGRIVLRTELDWDRDLEAATVSDDGTTFMQDGKNLFFPEEAFLGRDWNVEGSIALLDGMNAIDKVVVIGVFSGDRMAEYTKPGYERYGCPWRWESPCRAGDTFPVSTSSRSPFRWRGTRSRPGGGGSTCRSSSSGARSRWRCGEGTSEGPPVGRGCHSPDHRLRSADGVPARVSEPPIARAPRPRHPTTGRGALLRRAARPPSRPRAPRSRTSRRRRPPRAWRP